MNLKDSKNIYIVYGVSGCGKTTIGKELAKNMGIPFYDADDFHPKANIEKMSKGNPLNDEDRQPWLEIISKEMYLWKQEKGAVLACSALKNKYRDTLEFENENSVKWIFLEGSYSLIAERMQARKNHFFKPSMLTSQFETLEKPTKGVSVSINATIPDIITDIKSKLTL